MKNLAGFTPPRWYLVLPGMHAAQVKYHYLKG